MSKKDLLLGRSRALMGGRKLTSLSDFQETPMDDAPPEPVLIQEAAPVAPAPVLLPRREAAPAARSASRRREEGTPEAAAAEPVHTRTYDDVQLREDLPVERPAPLPRREEGTPESILAEPVQTRTHLDVQRRTKVALKLVRLGKKSLLRVPALTLAELDAVLQRFFIEDYNRQPHSTTGIAPQERWHGKGFLPRMPESLEQLDLLLLTVVQPRRVQQDGIRFQGFRYIDPVLAAYVGEWVTIRYDPRDMAEIRVFYRDAFLCRAVCQELAGETVSLREIVGARRKRTRELRQVLRERHALYGQTFPPVHVQHQMPEIRPLEPQPPAQAPAASSLKYYGCD